MMINSCQKHKEIAKKNISKSFLVANKKITELESQIAKVKKSCIKNKSKIVDQLMRLANDIKTNKCRNVETVFTQDLCQDISDLKKQKSKLLNQMTLLNNQRSKFQSKK